MTDARICSGDVVCENCGDPAVVEIPVYREVRYKSSTGRITTGQWASSCLDCVDKVEQMTEIKK